jgi:hypothetical protein
MLRILIPLLLAAVSFAQSASDVFNKPPADVDQALRARISEFYELHMKGQFRKAEELVAEDTKDFFYSANKPRYEGFEISRIEYSDNFTRAKATIICTQWVMMPGFADKPMKVPTPSTWKLVDGKWYWYVDPASVNRTPFGTMKPGAPSATGGGAIPAIPTDIKDADWVFKQVRVDRETVNLKAGDSGEVTITNGAPGPMNISLVGAVPGVETKLDHGDLKAGDKAVLTLHAGASAKPGTINIRVEQTGQLIPVQVVVK